MKRLDYIARALTIIGIGFVVAAAVIYVIEKLTALFN